MVRACGRVREIGGLERTNSFTRLYLALAGVIGWEMVPAIPPELMFLPQWVPINIYEMSSWTRAIVIPLTILYARKPCWPVPSRARIDELFCSDSPPREEGWTRHQEDAAKLPLMERTGWSLTSNVACERPPHLRGIRRLRDFLLTAQPPLLTRRGMTHAFNWRNAFLTLDHALKLYDRLPWKPCRERAVRRARQWMMDHFERSEGLAAIYPAMMNSIFASMALGYPPDHPVTARQIDEFSRFEIEEPDTLRVQPCLSPVWDTAIAVFALLEAGTSPADVVLRKA